MSTTFKHFRVDNIVRTKYTAHKNHEIKIRNFSGSQSGLEDILVFGYESLHVNAFLKDSESGRILIHDQFLTGSFGGTTFTELQTTNGLFKRSLHNSIAHLYYNGSHAINVNLDKSFCVEPTRNEYRELNSSAQIISIPQQLFGDKIQENDINFDPDNPSLKILSGTIELREDGFGNLYDQNAAGLSNALKTYHSTTGSLVGYWGFNELYPFHQDGVQGHCPSFFVGIKDGSRYNTPTFGQTVFITTASNDTNGSLSKHGSSAMFTGQKGNVYDTTKFSYFYATKHQNLDFRKDEDFAISMWAHLPPSQSNTDGLFNYVLTSGQGFHEDSSIESGFQKSKFPFDIVMYNQTAGVRESANLTFAQRNYADSAAKQIFRIRNRSVMTASAHTASLAFNFAPFGKNDITGSAPFSSAFQIGHDTSNLLTFVMTGSDWNGFGSGNPNLTSPAVVFIPIRGTGGNNGVFNTATRMAEHFNSAATQSAYADEIGMMNVHIKAASVASYTNPTFGYDGHLHKRSDSVKGTNFDEEAGANFVFMKGGNSGSGVARTFAGGFDPSDDIDGCRVESNTGSFGGPSTQFTRFNYASILRQPSESAGFTLKDVLGTPVAFTLTSASTAVYPKISVHGSITSSMTTFANTIVDAINAGLELGQTASTSPRILRISSSAVIPARHNLTDFGAEILLTSSIAGDFSDFGVASVGPGHNNMQIITLASNVFNNFPFGNTPEPSDSNNDDGFDFGGSPYPDFFTGSFFILSCRPTESYAPSENIDPDPAIHEKHVFYWKSGSSTAPDLGTFTTHSTTEINLGSTYFFPGTTAEIQGAYDYWNVASRSFNAINAHPSFSVDSITNNIKRGGASNTFSDPNVFASYNGSGELFDHTISGSHGNETVGPAFPVLENSSAGLSNIVLNIRARNHGITPVVISGSQSGPLFSASSAISAIPSTTASIEAFDGTVGRPGHILARRNDGVNLYQLSSSTLFIDNQTDYHHILFQKTGSNLELYMNNTIQQTLPAKDQGDPKNKDDIYFAVATRVTWSGEFETTRDGLYRINPGTGDPVRKMVREFMRPISGAMDEIKIFDKALNPDQRQLLYNCPNGTPFVGNVMHEHGIITITHPSSAYANIARNCTASFRNTFEIFENSYTAEIKRGEFNFTMNPTILAQTAEGKRESQIASFVTDTDWDPYITTIGLYDDSARLLAVGKLSRPLRKDDGYDTTIEVRFDT